MQKCLLAVRWKSRGISLLIQSRPVGCFLASHPASVSQALQYLACLLACCLSTTDSYNSFHSTGRVCKRKSMVNLYQTSPSLHGWHFPDEALQFHLPCLSASSVPSSNPYRLHTPSPDPIGTPAWDPLPWSWAYLEGVVHMQLH